MRSSVSQARGRESSNGVDCDMDEQMVEDCKIDDLAEPVLEVTKQNRRKTILAVMVTAIFLLAAVQTIVINA